MEKKTSAVTSQKWTNNLNQYKRRAALHPHTSHFLFSLLVLFLALFSSNWLLSQSALRKTCFCHSASHTNDVLQTLYVPGLRQVSYESHYHPHVHPCPHGDGKGGHEQGSSGAYSCPGEVSLSIGLARLSKQNREWSEPASYSLEMSVWVGVKPHLR